VPNHLLGLRRLSPCCKARVAHHKSIRSRSLEDALALICAECHEPVKEFELWNVEGVKVWPVEGDLPPFAARSRRRRVPLVAEPRPYAVHLPGAVALLRRLK
jgi:hypothetical protein